MPPSGKRPNARGEVGQAKQIRKSQEDAGLNFRKNVAVTAAVKASRLEKQGLPKSYYGDPSTKTHKVSKKAYDEEQGRLKAAVGRRKAYNAKPASERTFTPDFPKKSKQKPG